MEIKPKTPAAQASMMELLGIKPEVEQPETCEVKPLTKQKPFDLKTAKRSRVSFNDENEDYENNSEHGSN